MAVTVCVTLGTVFFAPVVFANERQGEACTYEVCSQRSIRSSLYLRDLCGFAASAGPFRTTDGLCNSAAPAGERAVRMPTVLTEAAFDSADLRWYNGSLEQLGVQRVKPRKEAIFISGGDETRRSSHSELVETTATLANVDTTSEPATWDKALLRRLSQYYEDLRRICLPEANCIDHMMVPHQHVWRKVSGIHRHGHHDHPIDLQGVIAFFSSVEFFEWALFLIAASLCLFLCRWILELNVLSTPHQTSSHVGALIVWLLIGIGYNRMVWWRLGRDEGLAWTSGYLLEVIFSIENVFVFSSVIDAFKVPEKSAQKAIFIVICCQVLFQMALFMGLASWLRSLNVLPYILGAWIMYVGWCVAYEHKDEKFDIAEAFLIKCFKLLFGDRFSPTYEETGSIWVREPAEGRVRVTLLAAAIFSLVCADFCLEVDVTLSKIEEIRSHYICFTSSAMAAFMVPELYLVIKTLAVRYSELKFGISFALIFFGAQMMLHRVYTIPDIAGCSIMIGAMIVSIVYAEIRVNMKSDGGKLSDGGAPSQPRLADQRLPPADSRYEGSESSHEATVRD